MDQKFYATLVTGGTYSVMGVKFEKDVELPVDKDLHDYLDGNPQFQVRSGESVTGTEDPYKDMSVDDLKGLADMYELPTSGTKAVLKARVLEYEKAKKVGAFQE